MRATDRFERSDWNGRSTYSPAAGGRVMTPEDVEETLRFPAGSGRPGGPTPRIECPRPGVKVPDGRDALNGVTGVILGSLAAIFAAAVCIGGAHGLYLLIERIYMAVGINR